MSKLAVGGHPIYKTHLPKRWFGFVKSYWTLYEVNGTVKSYAQKRNQATEWNQSQRGLSIWWLLKSRPSLTSQGRRSRYAYFLRASVNLQHTNTALWAFFDAWSLPFLLQRDRQILWDMVYLWRIIYCHQPRAKWCLLRYGDRNLWIKEPSPWFRVCLRRVYHRDGSCDIQ